MAVVVADLVARVRAEGVQETAAAVKAVGESADITRRALENMAAQMSKANPQQGSASEILGFLQRGNVQPTAAALAQAAAEAQKTTAAVIASVEPTKAVASAASEVGKGWNASESSLVRFGTALVGVNLGISLIAGAARTIHQAITDTVGAQLDWERSLVTVRGLYGAIGSNIIAISQAQAAAPGLLGSQQEFAQANLAASYLTRRYGVSQGIVTGLTTSAGAASFALGQDEATRRDLQARALAFAEGGGSSLRAYGIEGDPLSIARRLGGVSPDQLGALTPAQLRQAQTLIASQGLDLFAINSQDAGQPGLLLKQSQLEQARAQAQSALQAGLEGAGTSTTAASYQLSRRGLPANPQAVADLGALKKAVDDANAALATNAAELGNHTKSLADATVALKQMGLEAGTAAFRLLGFTGSVEDRYSIARGDIGASAQAAVAARARSAIPLIGQTQGERTAVATNLAYQQVYQNYVAQQAQGTQDNAIQEFFQNQIRFGPAANRAAAGRALAQAPQLAQINSRMAEAQQAGGLVDIASAETQARLEQITLTQRERYVQLMRETVDLRKLDVQQQMASVAAGQDVIRATQAALPGQYALSNAQYQGNLAGALARQRMGRTLRGQSVAGLPTIDELIQMNVNAQFAEAEAGPGAVIGARGIEMAQRTATAAGLAQQLTAGNLQNAELANDLKNLGDLPSQTALMLEGIQNDRDRLAVQKELRDLTKDLVNIMRGRPASNTSDQGIQDIVNRVGAMVFGDDGGSDIALPAPSDQPGARRGPY